MKSIILSLTLAASMAFTACAHKGEPVTPPSQSQTVAVSTQPTDKVGAHLCGAPTKTGKPCTRRVSDVHGKDAHCWQHQ